MENCKLMGGFQSLTELWRIGDLLLTGRLPCCLTRRHQIRGTRTVLHMLLPMVKLHILSLSFSHLTHRSPQNLHTNGSETLSRWTGGLNCGSTRDLQPGSDGTPSTTSILVSILCLINRIVIWCADVFTEWDVWGQFVVRRISRGMHYHSAIHPLTVFLRLNPCKQHFSSILCAVRTQLKCQYEMPLILIRSLIILVT